MELAFLSAIGLKRKYSKTSVAQTLMAHVPQLFQTHSGVPYKTNP